MISGAGARDVEQVALAVLDFFEIGIVGYILNAHLRRDDLLAARHDGDRTNFDPFRKMYRADQELAWRDLDPIAEFDRRDPGLFDGIPRPAKLAGRAAEHADFVPLKSVFDPALDPFPDRLGLLLRVIESLHR